MNFKSFLIFAISLGIFNILSIYFLNKNYILEFSGKYHTFLYFIIFISFLIYVNKYVKMKQNTPQIMSTPSSKKIEKMTNNMKWEEIDEQDSHYTDYDDYCKCKK